MFRYSLQDLQPHPDLDITTLVLGFSVIISSLLARSFVISLYFISSSFHFFFLFLSFFPSFFSSFFSPFLFPYIYHFLSSTRFFSSFSFSLSVLSFFIFIFILFRFFTFFLSNIFRCFFLLLLKILYFLLPLEIYSSNILLFRYTYLFIFHFLPCRFPLFFFGFFPRRGGCDEAHRTRYLHNKPNKNKTIIIYERTRYYK